MSAEEVQVTEEIQIDTKLFRSWRKKSAGYRHAGPSFTEKMQSGYQYTGPTFTNHLPAFMDSCAEKHWTPIEVAKQWGVSPDLIRSLFRDEPGVLKFDRPGTRAKRSYATLRIPDSVLVRVHTRMTSRATVLK